MSHSQEYYLALMYRYVKELADDIQSEGITPEKLCKSTLLQRSVSKGIELVGETAWQLDKLGADLGPDIPLRDIAGMRHLLVHHYDGVDWAMVEEVAFDDIPKLLPSLEAVMQEHNIDPI